MNVKKLLLSFVLIFASLPTQLHLRVPENLAGTDVFTRNTVMVKGKEIQLPLQSLNLCYGAEFFHTLAQVFYKNGNICKLKQEETDGKKIWVNNFYEDIVTKEPLKYKEACPLGILMRILFWQDPGSSSLQCFHVSRSCSTIEKGAINWDKTIAGWAKTIVSAALWYQDNSKKIDAGQINQAFVLFNSSFLDTDGQPKKFNLTDLFANSVSWCKEAGFEENIPLRALMAGVYEIIGHDQQLIFKFYEQVINQFKKQLPTGTINPLLPEKAGACYKIEQYSADNPPSNPDESWTAFLMLKKHEGDFFAISYKSTTIPDKNITFPDCVETACRNIVCAMLWNNGTLNADLVHKDFQAFFTTYSTMVDQSKTTAHSDWAKLISNIPGILYVRNNNEYRYELNATFINVLTAINHILGLGVDLSGHTISINSKDAAINQAFIAKILPLINTKLQEKLGLPTDHIAIALDDPNCSDVDGKPSDCTINLAQLTLKCSINIASHAEIKSVKDKIQNNITLPATQDNFLYLKTMLGKMPTDYIMPHQYIIFLQDAPTENLLKKIFTCLIKKNASNQLFNIAWVATSEHHEIDSNNYFRLLYLFMQIDSQCERIKSIAQKAMKNPETICSALNLFEQLVEKEKAYPEAIAAAQKAMENPKAICSTLNLFEQLVEKEKAYPEAIAAAQKAMENPKAIYSALRLFVALVEKEKAYPEAIAAAQKAMENPEKIHFALNLFEQLVEKEQAYPEAIAAAQKAMKNPETICSALRLFEQLVEKEQVYTEAIAAAQKAMKNPKAIYSALRLFKQLVEKEQAYTEAKAAAQGVIKAEDMAIYSTDMAIDTAKLLLKQIFLKEQAYTKAKAAEAAKQQQAEAEKIKKQKVEEQQKQEAEAKIKADAELKKKLAEEKAKAAEEEKTKQKLAEELKKQKEAQEAKEKQQQEEAQKLANSPTGILKKNLGSLSSSMTTLQEKLNKVSKSLNLVKTKLVGLGES